MCGRYTLSTPAGKLAKQFRLDHEPTLFARYNIAPTQDVPVVRLVPQSPEPATRQLVMMHWGLIPRWARDRDIGNRLINARSETVTEKPSFKDAFQKRRCLLPADGFYEWHPQGSRKQPHLIRMADAEPFALAGLWERWDEPDGEPVESCTIVTTQANELMKPIHHRMPVILDPNDYARWLDPQASGVHELLRPYPADAMTAAPVSTRVNNPRNESPRCAQTLEIA